MVAGWALAALFCVASGLFVYRLGRSATSRIDRVSAADPDLQLAARTARATLHMFEKRLKNPEKEDKFALKARFRTPVGWEYLWVKNPVASGSSFTGLLDQNPIALPARKGQKVHFARSDVYDWLIQRKDGSRAGGFTEIALNSHQTSTKP